MPNQTIILLSRSLIRSSLCGLIGFAALANACTLTQADPAHNFVRGGLDPENMLWYDGTEVGEPLNTDRPQEILSTVASSTLHSANDRYAPRNAIDGNRGTAWCEGAQGPGIGESLSVRLSGETMAAALAIVPGYAKNARVWRNNPRVKRIRVEFLRSAESLAELSELGQQPGVRQYFGELRLENGRIPFGREQYFDFRPDFTQDMSVLDYDGVRLEILEVEAGGAKFEDTCISGLRFFEWN